MCKWLGPVRIRRSKYPFFFFFFFLFFFFCTTEMNAYIVTVVGDCAYTDGLAIDLLIRRMYLLVAW